MDRISKMIKKIILFICSCYLACNTFASAILDQSDTTSAISQQKPQEQKELYLFTVIGTAVKKHYIRSVSDDELVDNAIKGIISELYPYSVYTINTDRIPPQNLAPNEFIGIGVNLEPDNGLPRITEVMNDSPAKKAGIKEGDIITQIDNKPIKNMSPKDVFSLISGPKGSKIILTISRENENKPQALTLVRDIVKFQAVKWRLLEPNYGYICIQTFQDHSADNVKEAITHLKNTTQNKLQGVIIDLRNNQEGIFTQGIQLINYLLSSDKLKDNRVLMYVISNNKNFKSIGIAASNNSDLLLNVPIVILINNETKAIAEIVAGALQDYKRAIIVGEKSFGESFLQTKVAVDKYRTISFPVAVIYTPQKHLIQAHGIVPDVMINKSKTAVENDKTLESINDKNSSPPYTKNKQGQNNNKIAQQNNEFDLAQKDYQLYEALHLLKKQNAIGTIKTQEKN